jgi:hypothetical protein
MNHDHGERSWDKGCKSRILFYCKSKIIVAVDFGQDRVRYRTKQVEIKRIEIGAYFP